MKPLVALLLISPLLVPVASFGRQENRPLTHAPAREQIVQLEKPGYTPGTFDPHYPDKIQAADARVAMQGSKEESERTTTGAPR